MAEWLYEAGIGENRAVFVDGDRIIEARIELPGLRAGTVADARLTNILIPGRRGIATLISGEEVLVEPLDRTTEGGMLRIEIIREAIPEPGAVKRAKGKITYAPLLDGPDLAQQIGLHCVMTPRDPDSFEAAGWSELIEQAASGIVGFDGGTIRISLTPAMTLIDADGTLPALQLALAGVTAAARAIRAFGVAGNIGIDLPTVAGKADRLAIAEALDAMLPPPFERTAVNGFGFLQVVRPRVRASLLEMATYQPASFFTRALMRRAQRANIVGASEVIAAPNIIRLLQQNPEWLQQLERQNGGPTSLRADSNLSVIGGSINRIS